MNPTTSCDAVGKKRLDRLSLVLALGIGTAICIGLSGATWAQDATTGVYVSPLVEPLSVTVDPSTLVPSLVVPKVIPEGEPLPAGSPTPAEPIADPNAQVEGEATFDAIGEAIGQISAPDVNVPGINSFLPPDTIGDVGPNHYVQMVNATQFQVFNKQGTSLLGPFSFGGLWPLAETICDSDEGDPVVVYDHLADRWLLSQFASPNHMCIAISQTPNPAANTWFLYRFNTGDFPDYPKIGVWPDGYYMTSYEFPNLGIYVFDRQQMVLGLAAGFMKMPIATLSSLGAPGVRDTRVLPSDLDGPPPPVGTPNFFVRTVDDQQDTVTPTDRIEVFEAAVDWSVPSFSFTLVDTLLPNAFNTMLCNRTGGGVRDCIPQPDTASTVDALSNRPMMQLKYRNFGTHQALVFNQTIDVSGSINPILGFVPTDEVAGIRWYELRNTGPNWAIEQQGTYLPQANGATAENQLLHRWMGSAAMDNAGNIAIGFSIVNDDDSNEVFPGIRYTGRRFDDLPGFLPQGEQVIENGTASATGGAGNRWGDYSALSVDPLDDCTFWYTTHDSAGATQIASFRFDTCGADLAIAKSASPSPATAGEQLIYTVTVTNNGPSNATNVVVVDTLPGGVTFLDDTDTCVLGGGNTLTCDLDDIPNGGSKSFEISVLVHSNLTVATGSATITNTAEVSSDQGDPDPDNNVIFVTTLVNEKADLLVTKDCKPESPAMAGSTANCQIDVENLGPSSARGVKLTDVHFSNGAFTLSNFGTCTEAPAGTLTCDIGVIPVGTRLTFFVDFTTNEAVDVNDTARVTSLTPDPNTDNNIAHDSVTFTGKADLKITKSASPDPVTAGTNLTYDLTVDNLGPSTASNVVIRDVLPAGVSIISVSAPGGSCNAGVLGNAALPTICTFDTVAVADPPKTMQIVVKVLPQTTGILHNDARVSSDTADAVNANDLATTNTTVNASADVSVVKTVVSPSGGTVIAGNNLTYQIRVDNAGPSTAQDVELNDTLPATVDYVSHAISAGPGTCVVQVTEPEHINCQIGDLDPGQFWIVSLTVKVKSNVLPTGTLINNTATVSSPTSDPGPNVNSSTAGITTATRADLWIDKTGVQITGNPSRTIIYTLTVNNRPGCEADDPLSCGSGGPSDAQNVVVTDTLPLDPKKVKVVFVSPNCVYNSVTHKVVCTVAGPIPYGQLATFRIDIQVAGSVGDITNSATFTTATPDPVTSNNTDVLKMKVKGGSSRP